MKEDTYGLAGNGFASRVTCRNHVSNVWLNEVLIISCCYLIGYVMSIFIDGRGSCIIFGQYCDVVTKIHGSVVHLPEHESALQFYFYLLAFNF